MLDFFGADKYAIHLTDAITDGDGDRRQITTFDVVLAQYGLADGEDGNELDVIFSRLSAEDWMELATAIVALSAA